MSPPYTRLSAGIKVLHYLCHSLNIIGENAYMVSPQVNPNLRTPMLTQENINSHLGIGLNPIAVYPEIYHGNPLGTKTVVRYLLNKPGLLLGGPRSFDNQDILFSYHETFSTPEVPLNNLLYMPTVDRRVFHYDPYKHYERNKIVYYFGPYQDADAEYPDLVNYLQSNAIQITSAYPSSHEEMAELFRRSKICVSFHFSTVADEALLCGCPVYYVSTKYTGYLSNTEEIKVGGISFGLDEESINLARESIQRYVSSYDRLEDQFWDQLEYFVSVTQEDNAKE